LVDVKLDSHTEEWVHPGSLGEAYPQKFP